MQWVGTSEREKADAPASEGSGRTKPFFDCAAPEEPAPPCGAQVVSEHEHFFKTVAQALSAPAEAFHGLQVTTTESVTDFFATVRRDQQGDA